MTVVPERRTPRGGEALSAIANRGVNCTPAGTFAFTVESVPSCPHSFRPQHSARPPSVTAQVSPSPPAAAATPCWRLTTSTGGDVALRVPSPSCPYAFWPQHVKPPSLISAHV